MSKYSLLLRSTPLERTLGFSEPVLCSAVSIFVMAKKPRPVPDAKHIFEHALGFLVADAVLRERASTDGETAYWIQRPGMILSTLCSELLLKCLLRLENKPIPEEHDLKVLFDRIDPSHKARIEALWSQDQVKRKPIIDANERLLGVPIPRDLTTALTDCGKAFVGMRYLYEDPKKPSFYINFFPHILVGLIRDITGWQ